MPNGYRKTIDSSTAVKWKKTHKNGDVTKVDFEKVPNQDNWFGFVDDMGRTKEIGNYSTKSAARKAAKRWMQNNPKGLGGGGVGFGGIPGLNNNGGGGLF